MSSSSISADVAAVSSTSTNSSITPFTPSLAIQTACDGAQSAISSYSEFIFRVSGQYTNSSVLSSASTQVVENLGWVGGDAVQVNSMQNSSEFPEFSVMCSRLGGLFVSVYTYSAQITSRDSSHLVQSALQDFLDVAWSMLSSLNQTATDCNMIQYLGNGSDQLQQAFLSLAEYETVTEYYSEITFNCDRATSDGGASTSTNSHSKSSAAPPTVPTKTYTGSVFITTFSASTAESVNRGPLVVAGFLGGLLCLLV